MYASYAYITAKQIKDNAPIIVTHALALLMKEGLTVLHAQFCGEQPPSDNGKGSAKGMP